MRAYSYEFVLKRFILLNRWVLSFFAAGSGFGKNSNDRRRYASWGLGRDEISPAMVPTDKGVDQMLTRSMHLCC